MFGLGEHDTVETATISWPSGMVTIIENPSIDQYHNLLEAPCMTDLILTVSGETSICPGETVDLIVEGEFASYAWSNGTTESTLAVGETGNYSVTAYDADGCAAVSTVVSVQVVTAEAPVVTALGELSFCEGGSVDLVSESSGDWTWSNGEETQSINVTESGTYFLTVTDVCGNANPSAEFIVLVLEAPETPVITGPSELDGPQVITLESSSETTHWYDSETATEAMAVGATYELDAQSSTTVWVEDISAEDMVEGAGGRAETGEGQYHDNSIRWLLFDAYEDIVIRSVDVYANGAGDREIGVVDSEGNVVASAVFEVADGMNTLELDFELEQGNDYGLRSLDDDPQLWRDAPDTDMAYPYAIGDLASITQSTAGGNNAYNYYYFFYNWVVQTPSIACASERIPFTINVTGISETLGMTLDLYPNPSNGRVQLNANEMSNTPFEWSLMSTTGAVVDQGMASSGEWLDWSGLAKGTYVFRLNSEEGTMIKQVILQ
jgi:hypothetical protein